MTFGPGEGAWVFAPAKFTNTFVGEVKLGSTNTVRQGYNIYSSALPQAGHLQTDLGFVPSEGDFVYQRRSTGGYRVNDYIDGAWEGDDSGVDPTIAVGESFWVFSSVANHAPWVRNLNVGP